MSSSDHPRPVLAAAESQDMEHLESPSPQAQDSKDNHAMLRKRKKFPTEASISNTASLIIKRRRETFQFSSSSPLDGATVDVSHNGQSSTHVADTGERRAKTHLNISSGLARSVSPTKTSTGKKANIERSDFSLVHRATSAYGRSQGIQSTVTRSSSEEEEESTLLHSSGQTLKVASETETVNLTGSTQALGGGSTCRRPDSHDDHQKRGKHVTIHALVGGSTCRRPHNHDYLRKRGKHVTINAQGGRRKSRIREHQHDGEVLSPLSKIFTNLTARNVEVDGVFGSTLQDVSYGKTETACVVNSGCSSVEAKRPGRVRRTTDYGSLILQLEDSSALVHDSCSRELHGSSVDPDLCVSSCSDTMPSGLITPYKLYQPVEPSRPHDSVVTLSGRNSGTVDEILADKGAFATDQYKDHNTEATSQSSHALSHEGSSSASEQERENHSWPPTESKSAGDDGLDLSLPPTFVLSSGRMSQDEAKKLGVRPLTIDDAFDEYFAQLML